MNASQTLKLDDTRGLVSLPSCHVHFSSRELGWTSASGTIQHEAPFQARLEPTNDHLMVVHLGGPVSVSGTIDRQSSVRKVPPGGLYLWPAGRSFKVGLDGEVDTFHLHIPTSIVNEVGGSLTGDESCDVQLTPRMCATDPLLEQLALEICRLLRSRAYRSGLHVDILVQAIAAQLVTHHSSTRLQGMELKPAGFNAIQLSKVKDYVEEHLDQPISLADLAQVSRLSQSHFVRQFRASTGASPHQYVMKRRVERARSLLLNTQQELAQIALDCGFAHQEHLTNTFRRFTGATPASYRRQGK
jgi:AraC family transcriptional regulator